MGKVGDNNERGVRMQDKFKTFDQACAANLADEVNKILKAAQGHQKCAIGFITTDDFYGCYLCWDYSHDIKEYFDWENSLAPEFLYQPLVDVVEACQEIDFCNPSEEKWEFAKAFLAVLDQNIRRLPEQIFADHNFKRDDVLFFATMGDGDYVQEMLDASLELFHAPDTVR